MGSGRVVSCGGSNRKGLESELMTVERSEMPSERIVRKVHPPLL